MRKRVTVAFAGTVGAALAALAVAGPAAGQGCDPADQVPPGNSEIDQYLESVPGACGNERPDRQPDGGGGGSSGGGSGAALPDDTQAELEDLGAAGAATAALAEATSPTDAESGAEADAGDDADSAAGSGDERPSEAESGSDVPTEADVEGGSVFGAIADMLGGSDEGTGAVLPVTLAAILLGGLAFAILRRRRVDSDAADE